VAIQREEFPLPDLDDPLTAPFFAHAARRELAVPRCNDCGRHVWYPAERCPGCNGASMPWTVVSGRGTLFAWAVVQRAFLPAFAAQVPFVTGLIALEEDRFVRVVSYVVDAEPDSLVADQPLVADFRPLSFPTVPGKSVVVPMFRPT
jgi:uncharacterized protein